MNSVELSILIECCKVSLLQIPTQKLESLVHQQNPDWDKLMKMASYHRIRPVVYDAFLSLQVQNDFVANLRKFTLSQSIDNLNNSNELSKILTLLIAQNIRVLPYKGALFQSEFYNNRSLRESGDIDIFVHPEDAKLALHLLLKDGYEFKFETLNTELPEDQLLDIIIGAYGRNEVGLRKINEKGLKIRLDFHWSLYENYYNFGINTDLFFDATIKRENLPYEISSDHNMLIMILIHHGGRSCWLKLKYICDLLMILKVKGELLHWGSLEVFIEDARMKKNLLVGLALLEEQFDIKTADYNVPLFKEKVDKSLIKLIKQFWEESEQYISLKPRIKFERILIKMQDEGFSIWGYIKKFAKFHSYPDFIQAQKANLAFGTTRQKPGFFTFTGKVLTYLYNKSIPKNRA